MALVLLERLGLSRGAFREFLAGPGEAHAYMLHVGAGWAFARLPWTRWRLGRALAGLDPLLRWLAADGFGFHEGYFHAGSAVRRQAWPRFVAGYARRAFDHGLGRSLWFVEGCDPERIAATIRSFPTARQADLWSGVGLAAAYAGAGAPVALHRFRELAGEDASAVAQGAAFAAEARRCAGDLSENCESACLVLCGMSAVQAAAIAREEMQDLEGDESTPGYEVWRSRIQRRLAAAAHPAAA